MDETIGGFGLIGGGAAGLEVDIADPELGTPPHALVVARSEELTDTYLLVNEDLPIATPDTMGSANPRIRSDIAFFETGNGGAVFAFSSIAWCGSLATTATTTTSRASPATCCAGSPRTSRSEERAALPSRLEPAAAMRQKGSRARFQGINPFSRRPRGRVLRRRRRSRRPLAMTVRRGSRSPRRPAWPW